MEEKRTVTIEVTHNFNENILPHKVCFNAPYGVYGTHFDVECEVCSPLWVEALWHQVNFSAEGFTKEEFCSSKFSWLHKMLPTNLGSSRKDCHSAFYWSASFWIKKEGDYVALSNGCVYSLEGNLLWSEEEYLLQDATPSAPEGVPFLQAEDFESGTTVTLYSHQEKFTALYNGVVERSVDLEEIRCWFATMQDVNWAKKFITIAYPENVGKHCCILQETCDNNGWETITYWWLFPNKSGWTELGEEISLKLINRLTNKKIK